MEITFTAVDGGSAPARWAMGQYFAELGRRFSDGFEPGDALDEAASTYNPPSGLFLVAERQGETVGCGALLHLDAVTSEIKRMWVSPLCRGVGLGKRLLTRLEAEAMSSGRHRVLLDTNSSLAEAIGMYTSAGYVAIERYNDNPYAHHWFAKVLVPPASGSQ